MDKYIVQYYEKQVGEVEIEAKSNADARNKFNAMENDELDFDTDGIYISSVNPALSK